MADEGDFSTGGVLDEDFFDGAGGPPVPSWDTLGVGGTQGGIILPQTHPHTGLVVSYLTTQQTTMATKDAPSELLWYDNDPKGATYHKRPRKQAEFLVQTDIRDFSDCSENKREAATKNEQEDDGIRRIIIKGKTATDSFFKSARATFGGQGRPEIGARISQTLTGKRKKGDFKENVIEVAFSKASPETLRVVQDYMAENMPDSSGVGDFAADAPASKPSAGSDDPWASVGESDAKPGF